MIHSNESDKGFLWFEPSFTCESSGDSGSETLPITWGASDWCCVGACFASETGSLIFLVSINYSGLRKVFVLPSFDFTQPINLNNY